MVYPKQQHHSIEDITGIMVYDAFLNSETMEKILSKKEPTQIEPQLIQQGDVGVFGLVGSRARSFFIVIDKEEGEWFWTREKKKDGCQTCKRQLNYKKKGIKDTRYLIGFIASVSTINQEFAA